MKLFYVNGKNVMGRDCTKPVENCPIIEYMRNEQFGVKFNPKGIFFVKPYQLFDFECGIHVITMTGICSNCKNKKMRELIHDRTR